MRAACQLLHWFKIKRQEFTQKNQLVVQIPFGDPRFDSHLKFSLQISCHFFLCMQQCILFSNAPNVHRISSGHKNLKCRRDNSPSKLESTCCLVSNEAGSNSGDEFARSLLLIFADQMIKENEWKLFRKETKPCWKREN